MTTITIPKENQRKYKEFTPTAVQKRALEQSRKAHKRGEYITLDELERKLGLGN